VAVAEPSTNRFVPPHLTALTDEDGHYQIDRIPPGPHTLEARAKGFRRAIHDVEAAAETRTVDFQLSPWPGSVSGRVIDDAGNPVPDAEVEVEVNGDARDPQGATSAADGSFSIAGVPDGTQSLSAGKAGYLADRQDKQVTVAGAAVSGIELRLSAGDGTITGQLLGLDFSQLSRVRVRVDPGYHLDATVDAGGAYKVLHLSPGTWRVSAAVPDTPLHAEGTGTIESGTLEARLDLHFGGGHELDGVVVRNGEPLTAAGLFLYRTDTLGTSQRGATDYQGGFRFGGLDDGGYALIVSTPNGSSHQEKIEISGDRTIRVELRTASLSGRILDATDGSPVPGARIALNTADGSFASSSSAIADARGVFHLQEVGEGAWTVRASQDGYAPGERKVQVAGDDPPDDVEIRLDPTQGITVEALLAGGQPPERLQAAALDASGRTVASGFFVTGENGRTRISNVPPGSWLLVVQADASAPASLAVSVPGPVLPVLLPPAGQLHIQGPNDATARVTLTGAGGDYQALSWNGTVLSEWSLAEGTLTLDRIPAGVWQVMAHGADGRAWSGTALVTPGGVAEVTLK
jgi:protocatechuate 3,4-dioxygenase beta subunit